MLYARQRLLLNLLDAVGGGAPSTDFQKWLFLFTRETESVPSYEFVPYRFGCFSFTSYADKRKLIAQGLLKEDAEHWELTPEGRAEARRKPVAPEKWPAFVARYAGLTGRKLVGEVYRRYPYYAINSKIAEEVLRTPEELLALAKARPRPGVPGLVTIGYEGKTLEQYLNQLIQDGVTLLCDVRRNPLSRKYGFSKGTLGPACDKLGIRYVHMPELGIASDRRQSLDEQSDYDALFADYEQHDLPMQKAALDRIAGWIKGENQRVALTCFELHPRQCHRHCVADALAARKDKGLSAVHL